MLEFIDPFAPKGEAEQDEQPKGKSSTHADNGVPKGTIKEVLAWVGDDTERAHQAFDAEYLDDTPRKGLIRQIEEKFVAEVFQHPQFGGPDDKGGTAGSGVPEQATADGGEGDRTDTSDLELNKGGQEPTPKSNVPANQEAKSGDDGAGDANEGTEPDGSAGGHDSTYGSGVPADYVAEAEPLETEVERPEAASDHATAEKGERAEDNTGPYKQFIE